MFFGLGLLFQGGSPPPDFILLSPSAADSLSSESGELFLVSVPKAYGDTLIVSTQWFKERMLPLDSKATREAFAKEFYKLFEAGTTIQQVTWSLRYFAGYVKPDTLSFVYTDTITIRAFWGRKEFTDLVKTVQLGNASEIMLSVRGWKDSVLTTGFEDPNNDARALFKIHLRLIPGPNAVYLVSPARRAEPFLFFTRYARENTAITSRDLRFHGTGLESGCTSCHDGLTPSSGTLTADCGSCHKALAAGRYPHAPVEMKECGICHTLSTGEKLVTVEKEIPGLCYECHVEKETLADSALVQHPVASDCLGCHSPHSGDFPHLLKGNVYDLCIDCHDQYRINHPVGKHPMRFVKIEGTDKEISCVSCHDPHGSNNHALLKVGGSSMEICMDCHQK